MRGGGNTLVLLQAGCPDGPSEGDSADAGADADADEDAVGSSLPASAAVAAGRPKGVVGRYAALLKKSPLWTKSLTSGVLSMLAYTLSWRVAGAKTPLVSSSCTYVRVVYFTPGC